MPTYKLRFHELALAEWNKLDKTIREPFLKKLAERLLQPRVPSAALSGMPDCYKIKIQSLGYRLVYRVDEDVIYVTVVAVGKREKTLFIKVHFSVVKKFQTSRDKLSRFGALGAVSWLALLAN